MKRAALDVVGIGSLVADRIHRVPRIIGADEKMRLQTAPGGQPVQTFVGGVVLNHLGWAATLGLRTALLGVGADDASGRMLRAAMDRVGIEPQLVPGGSATAVAQIFVDEAGGRAIYVAPGAVAEITAELVRLHHRGQIQRASRLTTEVSLLPLETALEALRLARESKVATVVDLDMPPSEAVPVLGDEAALRAVLEHADLLKPTLAAGRELVPEAGADVLAVARALRRRFGCGAVVVTDGAAGCAVAAEGFEGRVDAFPVRAQDGTGAGDAFLGGLLAGLERGLGWRDAARLGSACGAACVEQLGAFPEDPAAARARVLELWDGPRLSLRPLPAPPSRGSASRGRGEAAGSGEALAAMDIVLEELVALRRRIDPRCFGAAVDLIRAAREKGGRVHVTGVGKPEHVAHYTAALLSSTGTPATFLHGTEVIHGSAGQVVPGDVVIAVSNSGETVEMRAAIETVRNLGARIIAVTGRLDSWLAHNADVTLEAGVGREAGGLGLAPRASFAAEVLVAAALSAALESASGFSRADYHARHPAGLLGQRARKHEHEE